MLKLPLLIIILWNNLGVLPRIYFVPQESYIEMGSNLTIYCIYSNPSNSLKPGERLVILTEGQIIESATVNATAVRFQALNVTTVRSYICRLNTTSFPFDFLKLQPKYNPPVPTEKGCFSEDFRELVCFFRIPPDKNMEPFKTVWSLNYSQGYFLTDAKNKSCKQFCHGNEELCRCCTVTGSSHGCSCRLTPLGDCFFRNMNYEFHLVGANQIHTVSYNFTVKTDISIVNISKLQNLAVATVSHTALRMTWDWCPEFSDAFGSAVYMLVTLKADKTFSKKNVTKFFADPRVITLDGLVPKTSYDIQLRYKLIKSKYWSNVMKINSSTLPEVPVGPLLTQGAYSDNDGCSKLVCCFRIYWKQNPVDYERSRITAYRLSFLSRSKVANHTSRESAVLNAGQKDCGFTVSIRALSKEGQSEPAHVFIPKKKDALLKPFGVVAEKVNDSSFIVSWMLKNDGEVVNVTVFWILKCDDGCTPDRNYVDWDVLPAGEREHGISLEKPHQAVRNIRFAVLANAANRSSGLNFNKCIFSYDGIASKQPRPSLIAGLSGFELKWPPMPCDKIGGKPLLFQIFYTDRSYNCSKNDTVKNVTAVGEIPEVDTVKIHELKPYTNYTVCFRIITKSGPGPMSSPESVVTKEEAPGTSPRNLTAGNVTASTVQLTWLPPVEPNGNITHYIVKSANISPKKAYDVTIVISDLLGFTTYNWTVKACNRAGCSLWSVPIAVKTGIKAPSVVRNIVVIAKARNELLIKWESPEEPNGPISYYNLVLNRNKGIRINGSVHSYLKNISCTDGPKDVQVSIQAVTIDDSMDYSGNYTYSDKYSFCLSPVPGKSEMPNFAIVLMVLGIPFLLVVIVVCISFCYRKVNKNIKIEMPGSADAVYTTVKEDCVHSSAGIENPTCTTQQMDDVSSEPNSFAELINKTTQESVDPSACIALELMQNNSVSDTSKPEKLPGVQVFNSTQKCSESIPSYVRYDDESRHSDVSDSVRATESDRDATKERTMSLNKTSNLQPQIPPFFTPKLPFKDNMPPYVYSTPGQISPYATVSSDEAYSLSDSSEGVSAVICPFNISGHRENSELEENNLPSTTISPLNMQDEFHREKEMPPYILSPIMNEDDESGGTEAEFVTNRAECNQPVPSKKLSLNPDNASENNVSMKTGTIHILYDVYSNSFA